MRVVWCIAVMLLYPPHNEVVGGILVSLRPSVCPMSVPCPLCSFFSSGWIHFIFIHLIKQLQKMSRAKFLAKFQNFKFCQFFKICNFVLFWLGIWCESLVWLIMGRRGVSQNAGVLVVLVLGIIFAELQSNREINTKIKLKYTIHFMHYFVA